MVVEGAAVSGGGVVVEGGTCGPGRDGTGCRGTVTSAPHKRGAGAWLTLAKEERAAGLRSGVRGGGNGAGSGLGGWKQSIPWRSGSCRSRQGSSP